MHRANEHQVHACNASHATHASGQVPTVGQDQEQYSMISMHELLACAHKILNFSLLGSFIKFSICNENCTSNKAYRAGNKSRHLAGICVDNDHVHDCY